MNSVMKISDVFPLIRNGANIKQGGDNSGYPITRIETISNKVVDRNKMGYAGITDIKKYEDYVLQDGDILMSHINSEKHLGKTALYRLQENEIVIHGMNLLCLRPNPNIILSDYAFYFLSSDAFFRQVPNITKKSVNQASFTVTALKDLFMIVPNLKVQSTIVNTLKKVDELIKVRNEQLSKLDELVKSRFIELFGGADYPKVLFENVCVFLRNGASIKQTKGAGGYPITRIETLSNDVFNIDRLGYADITDLEKYQSYVLHNGDILISHINSVAYLGRAVQYRGQLDSPIIHGMNLLCARIADSYNPTYIEWFFKTPMAKEYISTITKKAVNQASITTSDLKKMLVPNPPKSLQDQFAAFVEQTDKLKLEVKESLEKLETLKKSLMQKYFG